MADSGEGPRGASPPPPSPPFVLDQIEARRAEKKFFFRPHPNLSQGLDDRALPLSEGLDPPLLGIL